MREAQNNLKNGLDELGNPIQKSQSRRQKPNKKLSNQHLAFNKSFVEEPVAERIMSEERSDNKSQNKSSKGMNQIIDDNRFMEQRELD